MKSNNQISSVTVLEKQNLTHDIFIKVIFPWFRLLFFFFISMAPMQTPVSCKKADLHFGLPRLPKSFLATGISIANTDA